jgi:sugar phosphate isomerase/epimerase
MYSAPAPPAQVRDALTAEIVFGVELDDAAADVVGTLFDDTTNERLLCGEGTFDLTGLVRALTAIGYVGPWGVEIISTAQRARPLLEAVGVAHESAEGVIAAAMRDSVAH